MITSYSCVFLPARSLTAFFVFFLRPIVSVIHILKTFTLQFHPKNIGLILLNVNPVALLPLSRLPLYDGLGVFLYEQNFHYTFCLGLFAE